jgi:1,4-dihydroxy-2-naphthoate octaprenyltransferase
VRWRRVPDLRGGPFVFAIGLASILSGVAYTAGPYPLGYNGLGDLFVFVFFGLVAVAGTSWVAIGSISPEAWLAAVPVGALATCVLIVNNVRDYATDVEAGKRTLVVRFGRNFGVVEYAVALLAASVPFVWSAERPLPCCSRPCRCRSVSRSGEGSLARGVQR